MKSIKMLNELLDGRDICTIEKKDSAGNNVSVLIKKRIPFNKGELESSLLEILPIEYVELLSFSNGMELFNYDDIDGLKLLSLKEIEDYTFYGKRVFEEDWQDNVFLFAKILGEDNYLGFKVENNKYEILDCYFEESPSEWSVISDNFDLFLENYIAKKGEKFWID